MFDTETLREATRQRFLHHDGLAGEIAPRATSAQG
jgi:hypothetical protein